MCIVQNSASIAGSAEQDECWEMKGRGPRDLVLLIPTPPSSLSTTILTSISDCPLRKSGRPAVRQSSMPISPADHQQPSAHTVPTEGSDYCISVLMVPIRRSAVALRVGPAHLAKGSKDGEVQDLGFPPANAALAPLIRTRISIELGVICRSRTIGPLSMCLLVGVTGCDASRAHAYNSQTTYGCSARSNHLLFTALVSVTSLDLFRRRLSPVQLCPSRCCSMINFYFQLMKHVTVHQTQSPGSRPRPLFDPRS